MTTPHHLLALLPLFAISAADTSPPPPLTASNLYLIPTASPSPSPSPPSPTSTSPHPFPPNPNPPSAPSASSHQPPNCARNSPSPTPTAAPEIEFLRDALAAHQHSFQNLHAEHSASAVSETMSMILRLQGEKADTVMEARQFRRFAEERIAHDQYETAALEDLFKRDQIIPSLSCEIQAYRYRLASYGISSISVVEPNTPDSSDPLTE